MIDLYSPLQAGLAALLTPLGATNNVPVFSHVPQNTVPPYILIADMHTDSEAPKGQGQADRMLVEVHCVDRGQSRVRLLATIAAIARGLHGEQVEADGAHYEPFRFVRSSVSKAGGDGVTYLGLLIFETVGQPA